MRPTFLQLLIILALPLICNSQDSKGIFYGSFVYDANLNNYNKTFWDVAQNWYDGVIEEKELEILYESLRGAVVSGKLKAKMAKDSAFYLSSFEAGQRFVVKTEASGWEPLTGEEYLIALADTYDVHDQVFFRFYEDWYFNKEANEMTKDVRGVGIGIWDPEKNINRQFIYIELNPANGYRGDLEINDVFYHSFPLINVKDASIFRFFSNALLEKCNADPSLLRDTVFPFHQSIKENDFLRIKDSVFNCYRFGFLEDWAFDTRQLCISKKVHAITFFNDRSYEMQTPRHKAGTYVFKHHKKEYFRKDQFIYPCVRTNRGVNLEPELGPVSRADSALHSFFATFAKGLDEKIRSDKLYSLRPAGCGEISEILSQDEYRSKFFYEYSYQWIDSIGNETMLTRSDSIRGIDQLSFGQSVRLDVSNLKVDREIEFIELSTFHTEKEIFFPFFSVFNYRDSLFRPDEKFLVARNVISEMGLSPAGYWKRDFLCEGHEEFYLNPLQMPSKKNASLVHTLFSNAMEGKILLYKPGTDSVLTKTDLAALRDSLSFPCLRSNPLPSWALVPSLIQLTEDWFYHPEKNYFFIQTREMTFCTYGNPEFGKSLKKIFSVRLNP